MPGNSNPYPYSLIAFLADYPGEIEEELDSPVIFKPQCEDLVCPNLGVQEYTITDDILDISFSSLIEAECPLTFTFEVSDESVRQAITL